MPVYQLNAIISATDLATITQAGLNIALIKITDSGKPLVWASFAPFENNTIQWQELYTLYASPIGAWPVVSVLSQTQQAVPQQNYTFQSSGAFSPPVQDPSIGANVYEVTNQYSGSASMVFGLAQGVSINTVASPGNPINAQPVPLNTMGQFTPLNRVIIYLQGQVSSPQGRLRSTMALLKVISKGTTIDFSNYVSPITVTYQSSLGMFVQG